MKRTDIRRILIIGAGPIVIGQACEFDYSGSQACRSLMAEGYEVILVNSNPATIMTDPNLATRTYIEPLTPEIVAAIIERERPDAILPTMGGQTALNIAHALHEQGVLQRFNVELIGANFEAIHAAEDREAFKRVVEEIGLESLRSETVRSVGEAQRVAETLGFPLIIRPAFTLGGSGGAIVYAPGDLTAAVENALLQSPIGQTLIEESALGWKEYEYEVMRDALDNVVIVCSVENVDPMGVHTGDSITVAPAQTLTDKEYHLLRNASLAIIRKVGVDAGGCNIQFAVHPKSGRFVVIEMNPRVSRSSALVSKATGVPIAKISAKLAVGMTLDEIQNDITRTTPACFEPTIDYVVTKIPRFSFEKFPGATTALSPQMKSVGEVMAIGLTFQESFQKALRGLEIGLSGFYFARADLSPNELLARLKEPCANRMRWVYQALYDGVPVQTIYDLTALDPWFIENFREIVRTIKALEAVATTHGPTPEAIAPELLRTAKRQGFGDEQIARILSDAGRLEAESRVQRQDVARVRRSQGVAPVYKAVDTCAGEFEAYTPYFYGSFQGEENEATLAYPHPDRPKVMILGGGPNRIGQGIEFDYCCVHAAFALNTLGYNAIMVNSNPETVSTDYDISDRLYFEPLTPEDVHSVIQQEKPIGVIAQLGGQTPLKLAQALRNEPDVPLLGTSADSIDLAEDRDRFSQALARLGLRAPESDIARTAQEAMDAARRIGFPLIARPSYVLGGQSMRIFYSEQSLAAYLEDVVKVEPDHPVLIERFLEVAKELDVDAVSDGRDVYIGAILEHVEHAGVHSGDSVCVFPAQTLSPDLTAQVEEATRLLAQELQVKGLLNIQFAVRDDDLYVLEVNPRGSRTVPFVCKSTGAPLIRMAVRVMLGESLADVLKAEWPAERHAPPPHVSVKAPVFPFIKFRGSDPVLGPEMRSTGEVMGVDDAFPAAYAKAMMGAGATMPMSGAIFISVKDADKEAALAVAREFGEMGFSFVATSGTAAELRRHGLPVEEVQKKHEGPRNAEGWIREGRVHLVINTPIGEEALYDDSYIRKAAVENHVPMATTMAGAMAFAQAVRSLRERPLSVRNLQELLATPAEKAALT